MANLAGILASVPGGLWEKIIFAFNDAFKNYALAIIILTICIKAVTLPLDFINRRSSKKMTDVQEKLRPKMAEIQKRYPDKAVQNQKLSELYQKEGFNPLGSCLTMLVVMGVSLAIFFTLFASLNNVAAYKIVNQYEQLEVAYVQEYVMDERGLTTEEEFRSLDLTKEEIGNYIIQISSSENEEQIKIANQSVKDKYKEVRDGFLWIKNVWIADAPTQKSIPSYETYSKLAKLKLSEEENEVAKNQYNAVMGELQEEAGVNGYYILAVLAAASAFFYQYFLTKKKKNKEQKNYPNQQNPNPQAGKATLIILPLIMLVFTLSYNSIFALYIIASQLFGMATAPLISLLIDKMDQKAKK